MGPVRLRLLDGFAFELAGSPVPLPTGLQRLLAFLGLRGPTHRSVLAGTLWPEVPEHQSLGSLRTGIWRINRLVPGLLETGGSVVAMSDAASVDSRDQESFATGLLSDRLDDDRVAAGIGTLWAGGLLPGWYDDWVVVERERLHQLRLHALERTAAVLLGQGRLEIALQVALEAVRSEPLRETSTAALISVYLAEGNVVDALRRYDVFRSLLAEELGLAPSPRLERLLPRCSGPRETVVAKSAIS